MEFNEKLQELRKSRGITQSELAEALYVSRTAVSKWESGRGYPSIDSLKALAGFFGTTVDALLSGEEVLNIAENYRREKENYFRSLIFGLLDCCATLLLFLPLFGRQGEGMVLSVSLGELTAVQPWLKIAGIALVIASVILGIATLAATAAFSVLMVAARLLSGVHWFSDIVGGVLLSGGLLLMYMAAISE